MLLKKGYCAFEIVFTHHVSATASRANLGDHSSVPWKMQKI